MGFRSRRLVTLDFSETPEFVGLEVTTVGATFGRISSLADFDDVRIVNGMFRPEDAPRVEQMYAVLLEHIQSWNLESHDGTPVPPTLEGIRAVDADIIMAIWNAWINRVAGRVPGPLERPSTSGGTSEEASLPMETLSENPPS